MQHLKNNHCYSDSLRTQERQSMISFYSIKIIITQRYYKRFLRLRRQQDNLSHALAIQKILENNQRFSKIKRHKIPNRVLTSNLLTMTTFPQIKLAGPEENNLELVLIILLLRIMIFHHSFQENFLLSSSKQILFSTRSFR